VHPDPGESQRRDGHGLRVVVRLGRPVGAVEPIPTQPEISVDAQRLRAITKDGLPFVIGLRRTHPISGENTERGR
jgi:hypothetical protein